jgi:DNA-binding NarL/FixJ family response regulator
MTPYGRVVIVHEDDLIRDIVRVACLRQGVNVVAETRSLGEGMACCLEPGADVLVIADYLDQEPVEARLEEVVTIPAGVIVLSADPSPERMTTALSIGTSGYLLHDAAPEEVVNAILAVKRGAVALNPTVAGVVVRQWRRLRAQPGLPGSRPPASLSPRETDVLTAIVDGLAAKAIARRLGMAVKTVENHKIRIFEKLGARTQAHAVAIAVGHGLVAGPSPSAAAADKEK